MKGTPLTKALLCKVRVNTVINYTSGSQTINKELLEQWDREIYKILTAKGNLRGMRKDIVYLKEEKGGANNIGEEVRINNLRSISNLLEAGQRQKVEDKRHG